MRGTVGGLRLSTPSFNFPERQQPCARIRFCVALALWGWTFFVLLFLRKEGLRLSFGEDLVALRLKLFDNTCNIFYFKGAYVMTTTSTGFEVERAEIKLPNNGKKCLLHVCCAPCSGEVLEALVEANIECLAYFYNPNIHPQEEYLKRKEENKLFAKLYNVPFVDDDYNEEEWFKLTKGMEAHPERGERCTVCFDMRLERAAFYAYSHGYDVIATSLSISRSKDIEQINGCGVRAAAKYPGLTYWTHNWRKKGGSQRMVSISRREGFYRQEYCGCLYSLRDSNQSRLNRGMPKVHIANKES